MTSKERVMAALEHREPDKVPVDFSGHRSSGIMAIAYAKLKEHLGITTGDPHSCRARMSVEDIEEPVESRGTRDALTTQPTRLLDEENLGTPASGGDGGGDSGHPPTSHQDVTS